jgi:hypothetical protein
MRKGQVSTLYKVGQCKRLRPDPLRFCWDYWGWKKDKIGCEEFANRATRDYLGFTGLGDRSVPTAVIAERDCTEAEAPISRTVASRESAIRQT